MSFKKWYKQNSRSAFFKILSKIGQKIYFIYENRNYRSDTNGENRILEKLSSFKFTTIFDVGANIGDWSEEASKYFKSSSIFAFEPIEQNFNKVIEKNNPQVRAFQAGFGEIDETLEFNYYPQGHELCSQFNFSLHQEDAQKVNVKILAGGKFCKEQSIDNIDFLKIDTEGADLKVLKGFEELLKTGKIKVIQFEYGRINIESKDLLVDFYNYLLPLGYKVGKVYPKAVDFRDYKYEHEDFIGPNFIAVKESERKILEALS